MKKLSHILIFVILFCLSVNAVNTSGFGAKEFDNPFALIFGNRPEYVAKEGTDRILSVLTADGTDFETAAVYKNKYASHDTFTSGDDPIVYEYIRDAALADKSRRTLDGYLSCAGVAYSEEDLIPGKDGGFSLRVNEEVFVHALGETLSIGGTLGVNTSENAASYENLDGFKTVKWFKAALDMLEMNDTNTYFSFKKTDGKIPDGNGRTSYLSDREGAELFAYRKTGDGTPAFEPAAIVYRTSFDSGKVQYRLELFDGSRKDEKITERKTLSYDETFAKLRAHDCYGTFMVDSKLDYNDTFYEIVYTDLIDHRYLIPCYKIYVRLLYNNQVDNDPYPAEYHCYNAYYVPAVEFDPENPGTGDAGVYAVASVSLLCLFAAQYVYKKLKRG